MKSKMTIDILFKHLKIVMDIGRSRRRAPQTRCGRDGNISIELTVTSKVADSSLDFTHNKSTGPDVVRIFNAHTNGRLVNLQDRH